MKDQKSSASEEKMPSESLSVGQILVSARKEQGLTTDTIAAKLCLTESYIKALESENFEQLPGDTFVRGYLRNYANLVSLNGEELVRLYIEQQGLKELTAAARKREVSDKPRLINQKILAIALIFIALISLIVILMQEEDETVSQASLTDFTAEEPLQTVDSNTLSESTRVTDQPVAGGAVLQNVSEAPSTSLSVENVPETEVQTGLTESSATEFSVSASTPLVAVEASNSAVATEVETTDTSLPSTSLSPTKVPEPEVTANTQSNNTQSSNVETTQLQFIFTGDCWYEVVDATGRILAQRTKAAGQTSKVTGVAPFKVILGDARMVNMKVAGEQYDLSRFHTKRTARFTVSI